MQIDWLYWEDFVRRKILAKHAVTVKEVEEVIYEGSPEVRKVGQSRYMIIGQTRGGRYLQIILSRWKGDTFKVCSAREMKDSEKRVFRRLRRR